MKLFEKLAAIQAELKAPKSQYNSFGKYHYRNVEDILEAAKPLNKKYGVTLTITDMMTMLGERYYLVAKATIRDEEDSITVEGWAREAESKKGMDDSQVTGATSSYARKYALNGLYAIDDTKDADTDEYAKQQQKPRQTKAKQANQQTNQQNSQQGTDTYWKQQVQICKQVLYELGVKQDELFNYICSHFSVGTESDIQPQQLAVFLKAVVEKKKKSMKQNGGQPNE